MSTDMLGVCCDCLEKHPVRLAGVDPDFDEDDQEHNGTAGEYVMAAHEHSFGGGHCPGGGTRPQAVYEDKRKRGRPELVPPVSLDFDA